MHMCIHIYVKQKNLVMHTGGSGGGGDRGCGAGDVENRGCGAGGGDGGDR